MAKKKHAQTIQLIVNADDFGAHSSDNAAILESIQKKIVTSTSLLVRGSYAHEVTKLVDYPNISIGLHLSMTEDGKRKWISLLKLFFVPHDVLERDFFEQIDRFHQLVGREPDHIDGHHHVHKHPKLRRVVKQYSQQHDIPLRADNHAKLIYRFIGWSFLRGYKTKKLSVNYLTGIIDNLPSGTYELMCHLGYGDNHDNTIQSLEPQKHKGLQILLSEDFASFLARNPQIDLISWRDV